MKHPIPTTRGHKRRKYAENNRRSPVAPPTLRYPNIKKEIEKQECRRPTTSGVSDYSIDQPEGDDFK